VDMEKKVLPPETRSWAGKALLCAGVLVMVIPVLLPGLFLSSPSPGLSRAEALLLGVTMIVSGVTLFRAGRLLRSIGIFIFMIAVFFLLLEVISSVILSFVAVSDNASDAKAENLRLRSGIYRPYVVWRANPFASDVLNIGPDGLRLVPGASQDQDAFSVFAFGGSTMIGWNTSDERTICGMMQRFFNSRCSRTVRVTNFGQHGYVSSQEVIELQMQLRAGNVPDYVVFYNGANDVWSACINDTAGCHFEMQEITHIYENRHFEGSGLRETADVLLNSSSALGLLRFWFFGTMPGQKITIFQEEPSQCMIQGEGFIHPDTLAEGIMGIYEGNVRIVSALSEEFGFQYSFFWQPVLVTGEKTLSDSEVEIASGTSGFLRSVYSCCEERAVTMEEEREDLVCLSGVFDSIDGDIYTDICHVNQRGDSLIAEAVFSRILRTEAQLMSPR